MARYIKMVDLITSIVKAAELADKQNDLATSGILTGVVLPLVAKQEQYDGEPKTHAEWIYDPCQDKPFVCSSCGWFTDDDIFRKVINYCPLCGAKIDEGAQK